MVDCQLRLSISNMVDKSWRYMEVLARSMKRDRKKMLAKCLEVHGEQA